MRPPSFRWYHAILLCLSAQTVQAQVGRPVPLVEITDDSAATEYLRRQSTQLWEERRRVARRQACRPVVTAERVARSAGDDRVIHGRLTHAPGGRFSSAGSVGAVRLRRQGVRTDAGADGAFDIPLRRVLPDSGMQDTLEVSSVGRPDVLIPTRLSVDSSSIINVELCNGMNSSLSGAELLRTTVVSWPAYRRLLVEDSGTRRLRSGAGMVRSGNELFVLRGGRVARIDLSGAAPQVTASWSARITDLGWRNEWQDEIAATGRFLATVDHGPTRAFPTIRTYTAHADGRVHPRDTVLLAGGPPAGLFNVASRLLGSRLLVYATEAITEQTEAARPLEALLAANVDGYPDGDRVSNARVRRWLYNAAAVVDSLAVAEVHSLVDCDIAAPQLTCTTKSILAPPTRSYTFGDSALYIATRRGVEWPDSSQASVVDESVLLRVPYDSAAPTAVVVTGCPVDRFAIHEQGGTLTSVQVPVAPDTVQYRQCVGQRATGSPEAPARLLTVGSRSVERPLGIPGDSLAHTQYVGRYVVLVSAQAAYGTADGTTGEGSVLIAHLDSPREWRLPVSHTVSRVVPLGEHALLFGASSNGVAATLVHLAAEPYVRQQLTLAGAGEEWGGGVATVSHGGVSPLAYDRVAFTLGVPTVAVADGETDTDSAAWLLELRDGALHELGVLRARWLDGDEEEYTGVHRMGANQVVFLNDRVFVVFDETLVAGVLSAGRVVETFRMRLFDSAPR